MKKVTIGALVIVAGIFLFCINTGILPYDLKRIIFSWQMLLVAIGFTMLFDKKQNNITAGVVLMLVGFAFLLSKIFPSFLGPGMFWPVLLIAAGVVYIVLSLRRNRYLESNADSEEKTVIGSIPFSGSRRNDHSFIVQDFIFSGSKEIISSNDFKGAEINAVFSGVEVDFSQCQLSGESKYININISSSFSGVVVYLPLDWNVQIRKTGVFGDFVDKRPKTSMEVDDKKLVILDVTSVFGGGEIRYHE